MSKALFLDRDGTLIYDKHYLSDPAGVELLPGVMEALLRVQGAGYRLFIHTNQSGVGRGLYTMEAVYACNARMLELLGVGEDFFAGWCIAPEAPEMPSLTRKPSALYEQDMIAQYGLDRAQTWMVGDRTSDWETGVNAGIKVAAVETGKPLSAEHRQWLAAKGAWIGRDFPSFVDYLLG